MSKSLFNLLKVSPAILGASVIMASGAYAAQSPEAIALQNDQATTTEVTNFSVSTVAAPVELAATPVTPSPEASTTSLNLPTAPMTLGAPSVQTATPSFSAAPEINVNSSDVLTQLNRYTAEGEANSQVTSISQLRDVSPRDWAFEALRNLVERYQCIAGYPDGTFQGNRAMTRFEFAAGLNACLRRIEALIGTGGTGGGVTAADLEAIRRLTTEFQTELAALGTRVNALEGRVSFLEQRQFSTTTKLRGEVVMQLSQTFNGDLNVSTSGRNVSLGSNSNVTFGDRVRLNLNTALSPTALLRTRLQARNLIPFTNQTRTLNTTLNVEGNNNNAFALSQLLFSDGINIPFVAGARFVVGTTGLDLDDNNLALNFNPTTDAISNFGSNRPIFNIGGGGGGIGFRGNVGIFNVALGYVANTPNDPSPGNGLFNGGYAAIGQIALDSNPVQASFTYSNTYGNTTSAGFGTFLSDNPFGSIGAVRETANNYQFDAAFRFSPAIVLGGFVNYSNVINEVFRFQKADVWSYGLNLAIRDVGTPGSTLGFVFGVPPVARRVQLGGGANVSNSATPYHAEVFYRFNINDNIDVTPGFFAVFRPDGDINRDTVYVGSVRTTFRF